MILIIFHGSCDIFVKYWNDKNFKNKDENPNDIFALAEIQRKIWIHGRIKKFS